jgi:hypothetical protein
MSYQPNPTASDSMSISDKLFIPLADGSKASSSGQIANDLARDNQRDRDRERRKRRDRRDRDYPPAAFDYSMHQHQHQNRHRHVNQQFSQHLFVDENLPQSHPVPSRPHTDHHIQNDSNSGGSNSFDNHTHGYYPNAPFNSSTVNAYHHPTHPDSHHHHQLHQYQNQHQQVSPHAVAPLTSHYYHPSHAYSQRMAITSSNAVPDSPFHPSKQSHNSNPQPSSPSTQIDSIDPLAQSIPLQAASRVNQQLSYSQYAKRDHHHGKVSSNSNSDEQGSSSYHDRKRSRMFGVPPNSQMDSDSSVMWSFDPSAYSNSYQNPSPSIPPSSAGPSYPDDSTFSSSRNVSTTALDRSRPLTSESMENRPVFHLYRIKDPESNEIHAPYHHHQHQQSNGNGQFPTPPNSNSTTGSSGGEMVDGDRGSNPAVPVMLIPHPHQHPSHYHPHPQQYLNQQQSLRHPHPQTIPHKQSRPNPVQPHHHIQSQPRTRSSPNYSSGSTGSDNEPHSSPSTPAGEGGSQNTSGSNTGGTGNSAMSAGSLERSKAKHDLQGVLAEANAKLSDAIGNGNMQSMIQAAVRL